MGILWGILFGSVGSMRRRASIDCFNGGATRDVTGVLHSMDNWYECAYCCCSSLAVVPYRFNGVNDRLFNRNDPAQPITPNLAGCWTPVASGCTAKLGSATRKWITLRGNWRQFETGFGNPEVDLDGNGLDGYWTRLFRENEIGINFQPGWATRKCTIIKNRTGLLKPIPSCSPMGRRFSNTSLNLNCWNLWGGEGGGAEWSGGGGGGKEGGATRWNLAPNFKFQMRIVGMINLWNSCMVMDP